MLATRFVSWEFALKSVLLPSGFLCSCFLWATNPLEIPQAEILKKEMPKTKKAPSPWDTVFQNLPWVPSLVALQALPAPQEKKESSVKAQIKPAQVQATQAKPAQTQVNPVQVTEPKPAIAPIVPQVNPVQPVQVKAAPAQAVQTRTIQRDGKTVTEVITSSGKPLTVVVDPVQGAKILNQGQNLSGVTVIKIAEPAASQTAQVLPTLPSSPRAIIHAEEQPQTKQNIQDDKKSAREKERAEAEKKREQAQAVREKQRAFEANLRAEEEKRRSQVQAEREKQRAFEAREAQLKAMMEDITRARTAQQKKAVEQEKEVRLLQQRLQEELEQKRRLAERQKLELDQARNAVAAAKTTSSPEPEKTKSQNNINVLSIQIEKVFEIKRVGEAFNLRSTVTLPGLAGKSENANAAAMALGMAKPIASVVLPAAAAFQGMPGTNLPKGTQVEALKKPIEKPAPIDQNINDAQKMQQIAFQQKILAEKAQIQSKVEKENQENREYRDRLILAQEKLREQHEALKRNSEEVANVQLGQIQESQRRIQEEQRMSQERQKDESAKMRLQMQEQVRQEERKRFEAILQEIRGNMEVEKRKSEEAVRAREVELKRIEADLRAKQDQLEKALAQSEQRGRVESPRPAPMSRNVPVHSGESANHDATSREAIERQRSELQGALARLSEELAKKLSETAHLRDVIQTLRNRLGQLEGENHSAMQRVPAPPRPPEPMHQPQPMLQRNDASHGGMMPLNRQGQNEEGFAVRRDFAESPRNLERTVDRLANEIKEIRDLLNELRENRQRPPAAPPAPPFYYGPYPNPTGYGPPVGNAYFPPTQAYPVPSPAPMMTPPATMNPVPTPSPNAIPSQNVPPATPVPGRTMPSNRARPRAESGENVNPPRVPAPPVPVETPTSPI